MTQLIDILQGLANEEISDMSLYLKEKELFEQKIIGGYRIAETFEKFARDEAEHYDILNKISDNKLIVKHRKIFPYTSIRKNLRIHIIREQYAISHYKELLDKMTSKRPLIEKIIRQEENHLKIIKRYLFLLK